MNRVLPILSVTLSLTLFSCGGAPASEVANEVVNTEATIQAAIETTLTAQPTTTPTASPTNTTTPRPTKTSTPLPTDTPTPTPTPTQTLSASVSNLFCFSTPFFFLLTLLLGKLYLNRGKEIQEFKANMEIVIQAHNDEVKTLKNNHNVQLETVKKNLCHQLEILNKELEKTKTENDSQIQELDHRLQKQLDDNYFLMRKQWLESISQIFFNNEVEVEVKFIHQLVFYLGYKENEFGNRVSVNIQAGHKNVQVEADWVLWDVDSTSSSLDRKAFVVIEAKAPRISLEEFQGQVRSYAMNLDAPIYVITNGKRFQVFQRGVQGDTLIINCTVASLVNNWSLIEATIGANARDN